MKRSVAKEICGGWNRGRESELKSVNRQQWSGSVWRVPEECHTQQPVQTRSTPGCVWASTAWIHPWNPWIDLEPVWSYSLQELHGHVFMSFSCMRFRWFYSMNSLVQSKIKKTVSECFCLCHSIDSLWRRTETLCGRAGGCAHSPQQKVQKVSACRSKVRCVLCVWVWVLWGCGCVLFVVCALYVICACVWFVRVCVRACTQLAKSAERTTQRTQKSPRKKKKKKNRPRRRRRTT